MNKLKKLLHEMLYLMTKKQRLISLLMFCLTFVSAIFECIGVSAVIPLISVIQNRDNLYTSRWFSIIPGVANLSYNQIVLGLCGFVVFVYIIKNVFFILLSWMQIRFSCKMQRELGIMVLKSYMKYGYSYFVNHNIGFLTRGITVDIINFYTVLISTFGCFSDVILCVLLCVLLIITDWQMTCAVAIAAVICIFLMFFVFRKSMKKIALLIRAIEEKIALNQTQIFYGIKDLMVLRKQEYFVKEFSELRIRHQGYLEKQGIGTTSPVRIIEAIFISIIMFTIGIKSLGVANSVDFVSKLAVFALGSFRILPAIGRISSSMNGILSRVPSIHALYETVEEARKFSSDHPETDYEKIQTCTVEGEPLKNELSLENVTFRYNPESDYLFKNLNLKIKKGSSIAIIGQSGAGKSTLVDILLGLLVPEEGQVCLDGVNITQIPETWAKTVGYIPQSVFLTDSSIKVNIAFGVDEKEIDEERVMAVIRQAELEDFVNSLPEGINTFVGDRGVRLSGGQRQRIAIARALYHNPQVMVLDEATSALDNETETAIMDAINSLQGQVTLIIVAHRLSTVKKCDIIYEVSDRGLVERNREDVIK